MSNRELAGRFDDLRTSIRELVGRLEYEAYQRDLDHRLDSLAAGLGATRAQHDRDIAAVHQRITDEARDAKEHRLSWRTVIFTGVVPALVVALSIVAQIWLAHSGGHH
jgi:hypothetical protein